MLWAATILESTADKFKPCFSSSSVIALTHLSEEVLEAHKALVAQCAKRKLEIWRKQDGRTGWVPPMPVANAAASLVSLGTGDTAGAQLGWPRGRTATSAPAPLQLCGALRRKPDRCPHFFILTVWGVGRNNKIQTESSSGVLFRCKPLLGQGAGAVCEWNERISENTYGKRIVYASPKPRLNTRDCFPICLLEPGSGQGGLSPGRARPRVPPPVPVAVPGAAARGRCRAAAPGPASRPGADGLREQRGLAGPQSCKHNRSHKHW